MDDDGRGGTYDVVSIDPALTTVFYLGVMALLIGVVLLLVRRRELP